MFWRRKREKSNQQVVVPPPEGGKKPGARAIVGDGGQAGGGGRAALGLSSTEVAELVGVSDTTILKWRRTFDKGGIALGLPLAVIIAALCVSLVLSLRRDSGTKTSTRSRPG